MWTSRDDERMAQHRDEGKEPRKREKDRHNRPERKRRRRMRDAKRKERERDRGDWSHTYTIGRKREASVIEGPLSPREQWGGKPPNPPILCTTDSQPKSPSPHKGNTARANSPPVIALRPQIWPRTVARRGRPAKQDTPKCHGIALPKTPRTLGWGRSSPRHVAVKRGPMPRGKLAAPRRGVPRYVAG